MCRGDPERALGQYCGRRPSWACCGPRPGIPAGGASPRQRLGTLRRGGQAEKRRQAPEGSTLPFFTPSPRRSLEGNRQGAARRQGGGGASSARKAQPPQRGGRGLLINFASAQAPLPRPAVGSTGPAAEAKQPESQPGAELARAVALRAAAGRRIMHTG